MPMIKNAWGFISVLFIQLHVEVLRQAEILSYFQCWFIELYPCLTVSTAFKLRSSSLLVKASKLYQQLIFSAVV